MPSSYSKQTIKTVLSAIGFTAKDGLVDAWHKIYPAHNSYEISVSLIKPRPSDCTIDWGADISAVRQTTSTFSQPETLVVLECVNRLLEKGYKPNSLTLEKDWPLGHAGKGYLDILVAASDQKSSYMMIGCKVWGKEREREKQRARSGEGQLFSYLWQEKSTEFIALYSSRLTSEGKVEYRNDIINVKQSVDLDECTNQKDLYEQWDKSFADNGIFNDEASPYDFRFQRIKKKDLEPLNVEDSRRLFNRFLEILRHNVVSDKPNAFNKIVNLFLCKIYDEHTKRDDEELDFQWSAGERNEDVVMRLNDLYKQGMVEYLKKQIADYSQREIDDILPDGSTVETRQRLERMYTELRLYKNQEFAFKEVYNKESFNENCLVLREIVQLLQRKQIRYTEKQRFLGDFFEQLLKESLKQESGQFFTPVPITRFICSSIPLSTIVENKIRQNQTEFLPFVIDYACGSGHFLIEAMDTLGKIIKSLSDKADQLSPALRDNLQEYQISYDKWARTFVYGVEKDWRLTKTTKLSCFLNGDGEAMIIQEDGLEHFNSSKRYLGRLQSNDPDAQDNQQFDVLITNPPYSVRQFKSSLTKGSQSFTLFDRLSEQSSEIECLFIERAKQLLVDGGYAGILLPASLLGNGGIYIDTRELLLKYFYIRGIVEFGSSTFMATGTNTIALFLERRTNSEWERINDGIKAFFGQLRDMTAGGHEKAFSTYINQVWKTISFEDYASLIAPESNRPNQAVEHHPIYQAYIRWFDALPEIKQIKERRDFKALSSADQECRLDDLLHKKIIAMEKKKALYFLLSYGQQVVLVKSGEKEVERQFLGYKFSHRRGYEGLRWTTTDHRTKLYNNGESDSDKLDPTKVNSYMLQNFLHQPLSPVADELREHVQIRSLNEMMVFDDADFDARIITYFVSSEGAEKPVWKDDTTPLGVICDIKIGGTPSRDRPDYYLNGGHLWVSISDMTVPVILDTQEKINDEGVENSSVKLISEGTTLLSFKLSIGRAAIAGKDLYTNEAIAALVIRDEWKGRVLDKYLFYLFQNKLISLSSPNSKKKFGTSLNREILRKLEIPLPDIGIQEQLIEDLGLNEASALLQHEAQLQLKQSKAERSTLLQKHLTR